MHPQPAQDVEAVDVRQPQVEDDEIERARQGEPEPLLTGVRDGDGEALRLQALGDEAGDALLVFDEQDRRHGVGASGARSFGGVRRGISMVNTDPVPSTDSRLT